MTLPLIYDVSHKNLADIFKNFDHILIPELNNGQLVKIIRDQFMVDAHAINKIMGIPFTRKELEDEMLKYL